MLSNSTEARVYKKEMSIIMQFLSRISAVTAVTTISSRAT
ncbi:hypothetical protein [Candidatus Nitrosocosmicus franklandus]